MQLGKTMNCFLVETQYHFDSRFIRPMKSISWLGNLVSRCSSWHKAGAKKEDVAQKGITATAESSRAHER